MALHIRIYKCRHYYFSLQVTCTSTFYILFTNLASIYSCFKKLESVQHKVLRYISYKLHRPLSHFTNDYSEIAELYNLQIIRSLQAYHDCVLTYKFDLIKRSWNFLPQCANNATSLSRFQRIVRALLLKF